LAENEDQIGSRVVEDWQLVVLGHLFLEFIQAVLFFDQLIELSPRQWSGSAGEEQVVPPWRTDNQRVELFGEGLLGFVVVFVREVD
jgi:hypothetical protein